MKKKIFLFSILLSTTLLFGQSPKKLKNEVIASIESEKEALIEVSDKIWAAAEIAFQEKVSSKTLIEYAKANGFTVEEGVAETPTAFVATYGFGKPVIGILGEFDALPGISQNSASSQDQWIGDKQPKAIKKRYPCHCFFSIQEKIEKVVPSFESLRSCHSIGRYCKKKDRKPYAVKSNHSLKIEI